MLFIGCSPSTHEWQARGNDLIIVKDTSKIPILSKDTYRHVITQYLETTTQMLKEREFQSITNEQAMLWGAYVQPPEDATLKPYLVRGVVYDGITYTVVRFDRNTGELMIHHATSDGENILGVWGAGSPQPHPLVIYLPVPPKAVYPTAVLGGDRIFRGRDYQGNPFIADSNESSDL